MDELRSLTARVQVQSLEALMGQSVDLSVLGAWGIIVFLCQRGQERAAGCTETKHLHVSPNPRVVFHGCYKSLQHSDSFLWI